MKKILPNVNVKTASVKIILIGIALMIVMSLLAQFNIIDLTPFEAGVITLIGSLFLLSEVGLLRGKVKGMKFLDFIIVLVSVLAIIGAIAGMAGYTVAFLSAYQAIVKVALLVAVLLEIFRKN